MRRSQAYDRALDEARKHHASSKTYSGKFLRPHAPAIKAIIDRLHVGSILDYGCGKGAQYLWRSHGDNASIPEGMTLEEFWGVQVRKFDPAWPPFAEPPAPAERFDLVLCTHTLGSIPLLDLLGWVIPGLYRCATKAVYVAEKLGPIGKQVFSEPDAMPRDFTRAHWCSLLAGLDHTGLEVWLSTHETLNGERKQILGQVDDPTRSESASS
jgi:hypothetical protein